MTEPDATVRLGDVDTAPTARPDAVIALFAAGWVSAVKSGTATYGSPDDTTRETALPTKTSVPAEGGWVMSELDGTGILESVLIAPLVRQALVSMLDAIACVGLVTLGTPTCGRPDEITRAPALPTMTSAPA